MSGAALGSLITALSFLSFRRFFPSSIIYVRLLARNDAPCQLQSLQDRRCPSRIRDRPSRIACSVCFISCTCDLSQPRVPRILRCLSRQLFFTLMFVPQPPILKRLLWLTADTSFIVISPRVDVQHTLPSREVAGGRTSLCRSATRERNHLCRSHHLSSSDPRQKRD